MASWEAGLPAKSENVFCKDSGQHSHARRVAETALLLRSAFPSCSVPYPAWQRPRLALLRHVCDIARVPQAVLRKVLAPAGQCLPWRPAPPDPQQPWPSATLHVWGRASVPATSPHVAATRQRWRHGMLRYRAALQRGRCQGSRSGGQRAMPALQDEISSAPPGAGRLTAMCM